MMKGMVFADRYKLVDFCGQGGMSLVYRAVDIRTGHSVAIKILKSEYNSDKEFLERFQREAQAASLMSHHNIVNLLDVGVEGEHRYLVLEYVSGSTLKEIIQQKGYLNTNTAIQIAIRILSALQHAHDNGIIHRDIKPQNVLVNSDGHIKVADFGIARMTNAFTISKGDTVVGSVHYSSPEQASGNVVEATSDIYSTGVVLYEMLTGRVPFLGDTPVSVAMQHINAAPPPITEFNPDVPPAVVAVVMKALEKSPRKRFQSAREMADALIRARDGKEDLTASLTASQPTPTERPAQPKRTDAPPRGVRKRKRSSRAVWTVLITLSVLAILALGAVAVIQSITDSAVAPDLIGLNVDDAIAQAKRVGLNVQQTRVNHDTIPAGTIISQLPEAEANMRKGDSIVATVSLGPVTIIVPNVEGLSREEAFAVLTNQGLSMVAFKIASTSEIDTVLSQNPAAGEPCDLGKQVEVTLSGGSTLVPDVQKKSYAEAVRALNEENLEPGKISYTDVDAADVDIVMTQSPAPGTMAVLGSPVSLTIGRLKKPYDGVISVVIPTEKINAKLRVTLVENGVEVDQLFTAPVITESTTVTIPVHSDSKGVLTCRVYLDGELVEEQEVTLE